MNSSAELQSILLDPAQSGAYFFAENDTAALLAAANAIEFQVADISLQGATDKAELMERLAAGLQIPSWFGGNWDGLADVLRDLSWLPAASGYLICLRHASGLRVAEPNEFDTLLDVLNEAAFLWADDGKPFWAILPLPSDELPDTDDD